MMIRERSICSIESEMQLIKIEYAGHGNRRKELFYKDFNELTDDALKRIAKGMSTPFTLMRYSKRLWDDKKF